MHYSRLTLENKLINEENVRKQQISTTTSSNKSEAALAAYDEQRDKGGRRHERGRYRGDRGWKYRSERRNRRTGRFEHKGRGGGGYDEDRGNKEKKKNKDNRKDRHDKEENNRDEQSSDLSSSTERTSVKVKCYYCDKDGHYARNCKKKQEDRK